MTEQMHCKHTQLARLPITEIALSAVESRIIAVMERALSSYTALRDSVFCQVNTLVAKPVCERFMLDKRVG